MLTVPKDQAHYPLEGQVVELLPWSALLSNGQKNAELSGFLAKVDGGYNPDTQELHITAAPGNDTGTPSWRLVNVGVHGVTRAQINNEDPPEDVYFYMRVWNRGADTQSPATINFVAGTPVPLRRLVFRSLSRELNCARTITGSSLFDRRLQIRLYPGNSGWSSTSWCTSLDRSLGNDSLAGWRAGPLRY